MSTTLLQSLEAWMPDSVSREAAVALGESEAAVERGLSDSYRSILAGIAARSRDPQYMRRVFQLSNEAEDEVEFLADVARAVGGEWTDLRLIALGPRLLEQSFGSRTEHVAEAIGRDAGLRLPSAKSLLAFAGPLVLAFLGRRIRDDRLDAAAFAGRFQGHRDELIGAAPAAVAALLGLTATPVGAHGARPVEAGKSRSYLGWLVLAAAVLAGLLFLPRLFGTSDPVGDALNAAEQAAEETRATVADAVADLGATVDRNLPGGATISVPEQGVERPFIDHIESAEPIDINRWFELDRVYFETGSATLNEDALPLMDNLAGILEAYPNVTIEVGGFADSTGDHEANQTLSRNRADAVRNALIERGIDGARVTATGYGDDHPLATNLTAEGRQQNRSALARVTAK